MFPPSSRSHVHHMRDHSALWGVDYNVPVITTHSVDVQLITNSVWLSVGSLVTEE